MLRIRSKIVPGFFKNKKGMAAVEFAMVAPVFFALLFSIMEVGWVFFSEGVAERAKKEATRLIRTGQIQQISTENDPEAQRKAVYSAVCKLSKVFGACSESLTVDVVTFDSFKQLAEDDSEVICQNSSKDLRDKLKFNPGSDDSIVRVRICILYNTLNPAIGLSLKQTSGESDRIIAQHIFRNEPFEKNVRQNQSNG
ncbi:MAG: TadE/TadG family type IV pilus assembly protein [Pseudomonadota bacterium]